MRKQKTLTIQEYDLPIVVESQKEGGYLARCQFWKDCYAQADTVEEVLSEISLVASSLIELYTEEELKIPLKLKKTSRKTAHRILFTVPLVIAS